MSGLLKEEQKVIELLVEAYNEFQVLIVQHKADNGEFAQAIHKLQGIIAMRPLRRDYPKYWEVGE